MKSKLLVALVTVFLLSMDRGQTQGALPVPIDRGQPAGLQGGIVFAPNPARNVRLTRNGALMASLNIPAGMFLSVSYDDQKPTSIATGRWAFEGDFVLRALPASEPTEPGVRRVEQVVNQAPLILTLRGVEVLIENVQ